MQNEQLEGRQAKRDTIKDSGQGSIPIPTNHRNVAENFTLNKPLATLAEGAMPDGAVSDRD